MMDHHIFIIGMPGSGKSSLGRKAAANLRVNYVDMDRRISELLGGTTAEIFARWGEQAFRNAETNLLIELTREAPCLVSTGGGTVLREENRAIMRASGEILLVDRPLEQILSDIKLDRRPLLKEKGLGEVERLYRERIGIYREAADMVLDNRNGYFAGVTGMEKLIRESWSRPVRRRVHVD